MNAPEMSKQEREEVFKMLGITNASVSPSGFVLDRVSEQCGFTKDVFPTSSDSSVPFQKSNN